MSTPNSRPGAAPSPMNLRGAVDLSALKRPAPASPGAAGGPAAGGPAGTAGTGAPDAGTAGGAPGAGSPFVTSVTEDTFQQVLQISAQVPVVIDLGAAWSSMSQQLSASLEKLIAEYGGRLLLAKVDVDASPQIAQAFALESIPAVVAVLKGQPVPLFQGALPEEQIRAYFEELLKVAAANGVTGSLNQADAQAPAEPAPLPPHHQEAFDAIEAGDYAAAAAAYRRALAEKPADAEAKTGLAQVELLQRVEGLDAAAVRGRAAEAPEDVEAQLAVADLDLVGGHVEDAFARLVALVGRSGAEERETARARLVELFEVVGINDPRVVKARSALARALF